MLLELVLKDSTAEVSLFIFFGFWMQWWVMKHSLGNFFNVDFFSEKGGNWFLTQAVQRNEIRLFL